MAEFKISRLRYRWIGNWQPSQQYRLDDVVYYAGGAWSCIRAHLSNDFYAAQTFKVNPEDTYASPAWSRMTGGYTFKGAWTANTVYIGGDIVSNGGNLYLCITDNTSGTYLDSDLAYWTIYAAGHNYISDWTVTTRYKPGDVIRYNGIVYECIKEHTASAAGIPGGTGDNVDDSTFETWKIVNKTSEYKGSYASNTRYRLNDYVKYGGTILKCIDEHTSSSTPGAITSNKFIVAFAGSNFLTDWSASTYYAVGDVVRLSSYIYIALQNNFNSEPGDSALYPSGNSNWTVLVHGHNFKGNFISTQNYKKGDLVKRGGSVYVALADSVDDGSTTDYLDESHWQPVIVGNQFRGNWEHDAFYSINDVVYYKGSAYSAGISHDADPFSFPGNTDLMKSSYWSVVIQNQPGGLDQVGDLLTYNLLNAAQNDFSTAGPVRIPIGSKDHTLTVLDSTEGTFEWQSFGDVQRFFHVRTNGVDDPDDPERGTNYFKPYRTIKFATEMADDGYSGYTTIKVYTGTYEEILPIIVPARTAILGEELRSVTVVANPPIDALANDAPKTRAVLGRIKNITEDLITGEDVVASVGNTESQSKAFLATITEANLVKDLLDDMVAVIDFKVLQDGTLPSITGTNTFTTNSNRVKAANNLNANKTFLIEEGVAYTKVNSPTYAFDEEKCRRDMQKFVEALIYDLRYPGNYKSFYAARYYSNAVMGSTTEDMFYVRDATGVRNLTLKGLVGDLADPIGNEPYQRPTGGKYVSLDPGWGPDDQRVWIKNRSCYVQNCTTFGYAAVGQKIDGSLHNGGNKSIVSNDFTQVISDGIGAWVTNGGRAELVSVFTYYAQIGMFAEDGGIIRATNGNSSYGTYGAVADGDDPEEEYRYGKINARDQEAIIGQVFCGGANDEILMIEWDNAGQQYSTANYTFVGSGTGAVVTQEEYRDNAVFEVQIRTTGTEYILSGFSAQYGTSTTITLATNDNSTAAELIGCRLIISGGEGSGQYGYIYAYDEPNKIATIYKESDNTAGWDHVIAGTPIRTTLSTASKYKVEPRPIFTDPGFVPEERQLQTAVNWGALCYGETYEEYNGIVTDIGLALFNITKTNRTYDVTLASGGENYTVGDILIIDGENIGGESIEHDIKITVTGASAGVITAFTYKGLGISGKYVLFPSLGDTILHSRNGNLWYYATLPLVGQWKVSVTGDNTFVAINYGTNKAAYSYDGVNWEETNMPSTNNWISAVYGNGLFVAISANQDAAALSANGIGWQASTLPDIGDSAANEWVDIAYGKGKFVAIAKSNNAAAVGTYSSGNMNWVPVVIEVQDSSLQDWSSIAYGNGRFVAISNAGYVSYSFDGLIWYTTSKGMPQTGPNEMYWKKVRYGQGVFLAVCETYDNQATTFCATSPDGITWTSRTLGTSQKWGLIAFGAPDITTGDSTISDNTPLWVVAPDTTSDYINKIRTGARATGRIFVESGGISKVRLWNPGSGYTTAPALTITDPNNVIDATYQIRLADGVLAQPTFTNRGVYYKTASTEATVVGDGFADVQPTGKYVTLDNLSVIPGPGAQFYIGGRSTYYTAVAVNIETAQDPVTGLFKSRFQISPPLKLSDEIQHDMEVLIKERYSQVRITGHDFLDVGSGNFVETNYPELYIDYNYTKEPQNEVGQLNGGRVFYTSTDQDGNFRAGELFAVEQATGTVTISADFFDLTGLSEIALGGIIVGGTATVVREFSKDNTFTANSNNIVPTQRAIIAYLNNRLNVGGEDLLTASFIAGTVKVGPSSISNTAGFTNTIPVMADFKGAGCYISGSILAQTMFFRSFRP